MPVAIKMPDLGTTVDEVRLVSWLVREGDVVKRGDPLAEIETDKAVSELESIAEGVVLKLVIAPDSMVGKGHVLAYVGKPGESVPVAAAEAPHEEPAKAEKPAAAGFAGAQRIAPVLRNLAQKLGIDLATVRGTGRGGMITRDDLLRAQKTAGTTAPAAGTTAPAGGTTAPAAGEELHRAQSGVAKAVLMSARDIPHLRVSAIVDMTAAKRIRAERAAAGAKVSYDALFIKAIAKALHAVPLMAAHLVDARVHRPDGIHVALAVGVDIDLFLPVIRDADRKDLSAVQQEIESFAALAREHRIKPEHMTGGCITLSNLGMYPIESFDPIIFPEHSAIVAVGAVRNDTVVVEDRIEIRPVVRLSVAADHRLINGRVAAEFVSKLKKIIESGIPD